MNYLAHFHLAGDHDGFVVGALLGDFVKGPINDAQLARKIDITQLPEGAAAGIQLHRAIDAYFDDIVKTLLADAPNQNEALPQSLLQSRRRRYLPIVLDLFFDFALANDWSSHSTISLDKFEGAIVSQIKPFSAALPIAAQNMFDRIEKYTLLSRYGDAALLRQIAQAIAGRLPAGNTLLDTFDIVMQQRDLFEQHYIQLYPQILAHSVQLRDTLWQATAD